MRAIDIHNTASACSLFTMSSQLQSRQMSAVRKPSKCEVEAKSSIFLLSYEAAAIIQMQDKTEETSAFASCFRDKFKKFAKKSFLFFYG
ncbi:hypothetical protein TNCV_2944931 [Trichonephila clavipes]|nr:hypothetical protein TNCV_2944931 [Trichonephila clavipes]